MTHMTVLWLLPVSFLLLAAVAIAVQEHHHGPGASNDHIIQNEMENATGWMVHVYPFEKDPQDAWSVERQMPAGQHTHH
jgi:hypothetical protein